MTAAPQVRPAQRPSLKSNRTLNFSRQTASSNAMATGRRRRVAVTVQIDEQLFRCGAKAFAHRVNDPAVRLMRNDALISKCRVRNGATPLALRGTSPGRRF